MGTNYLYYFRVGVLSHLKNSEFVYITLDILKIIDNVEIDEEHFISALTKVKSHGSIMRDIRNDSFKHPLTIEMREQAAKRRNLLRSIKRFAGAAVLTDDTVTITAGKKILLWMEPHNKDISYGGSKTHGHVVMTLQDKIEYGVVKGVEESLEVLGCKKMFDQVVSLTESIDTMRNIRSEEVTEMKKEVSTKRDLINEDIRILLSTLFNCSKIPGVNQDLYITLSKKIRDVITAYNAELQSRLTLKRNRKDAIQDEDMQQESDETKIADIDVPAIDDEFSVDE